MTTNSKKHAVLSASGSPRWMNCPGSVQMEAPFPDSKSEFAEEGTAAHMLAEKCFTEGKPASDFLGEFLNKQTYFPDGFEVTVEMAESVQQYIDFCMNLPGQLSFTETRVDFSRWVSDGFGTSDYIKINREKGKPTVIHTVDLKYGKGVQVYAEQNSQGMLYALGVYNEYSFLYEFKPTDIVVVYIHQPRLDHVSEYKITVKELLEWGEYEVKPKAIEALSDSATLVPGDKQCRFCRARVTCKALAEHSLKTAIEDFSVVEDDMEVKDINTLSNEDIGTLLPQLDVISQWTKAIQAHAFDELNAGNEIPGYKLVRGRAGNRKWRDEKQAIKVLKRLKFKADEIYIKKLTTPPQVDKILKLKKLDVEDFEYLAEKPEGKLTIAVESDKRQAELPEGESDFDAVE